MVKRFSTFLESKHDLLLELIEKLSKKFEYISILGTDCEGKFISVSNKIVSVTDSRWQERGFVVRVFANGLYSECAFDDITDVKETSDKIIEKVDVADQLYKAIYAKQIKNEKYDEEGITRFLSKMGEYTDVPIDEVIETSKRIIESSMENNEYIIAANVGVEYLKVSKMFISKKKDLKQVYAWANAGYQCIVNKNGITKSLRGGVSGMSLRKTIDDFEKIIDKINDDATSLLDAIKIEPGVYECITSPEVSGLIAHESFGHGMEMDMFVKNRALGAKYLGDMIGTNLVNINDSALENKEVASYYFDDEGTFATTVELIKDGKLKTGIADAIAAKKLGILPTGNGRRESYRHKAYTRMTSTYFVPGKSYLNDMIKSIKYGFFIDSYQSGMEDPKNWGLQCVALVGKEIKDGSFTGRCISPVVMTGYVPDVFKSIDMVSRDFKLLGTGTCGKGHKEFVKTAIGGPYLKVKVKIG